MREAESTKLIGEGQSFNVEKEGDASASYQKFETVEPSAENKSEAAKLSGRDKHDNAEPSSKGKPAAPAVARSVELDVLRSILAVFVVFHHFAFVAGGDFKMPWFFEMMLLNGTYNVYAFYVLSGVVISRRYIIKGKVEILYEGMFKRVPRLAIPVLAASIFSWFLANVGAYDNLYRAQGAAGAGWCGDWHGQQMIGPVGSGCYTKDLGPAIKVGLPPFQEHKHGISPVFPAGVTWTLQGELVGSMFIFLWEFVLKKSGAGRTDAVFLHILMFTFLAYLSFEERRVPKNFEWFLKIFYFKPDPGMEQLWRGLFLFEAGFAFEHIRLLKPQESRSFRSQLLWFGTMMFLGVRFLSWNWELQKAFTDNFNTQDKNTIGGVFLVYAVMFFPDAWKPCCLPFQTFGEISFGIYVLHGIVLYTLGANIIIALRDAHWHPFAAYMTTIIICMPVILVGAYVFFLYVEKPFAVELPKNAWKKLDSTARSWWANHGNDAWHRFMARFSPSQANDANTVSDIDVELTTNSISPSMTPGGGQPMITDSTSKNRV